MIIIKLIVKIALLPVLLLTIIGQWIGEFFTGIASVILGLLSTLAWVVAILSYLMGISSGREALQMMVIAFVAFIVPQICAWLIEGIVGVRCAIGKIMRS
jgi:VIT1/CCC1 family predicted Fe2+/Mn2+ transporter